MSKILIICFLSFSIAANSQRIFEQQHKFDLSHDSLQKSKGWKYDARLREEVIRRIDSDGHLPSAALLVHQQTYQKSMSARQQAGWVPEGPFAQDSFFGIGRATCVAFHPSDSLTFYLGFGMGGIWKTTDGGQHYTPMGDDLPVLRISALAVHPTNPQVVFAALGDFAYVGYDLYTADRKRSSHYGVGIYKSIDGGKTWKPTGLSSQLSEANSSLIRTIYIHPQQPATMLVASMKGIFRSTDTGETWAKVSDLQSSQLAWHPSFPNEVYASGIYVNSMRIGEACVFKSTDAGQSFARLTTGIPTKAAQRVEVAIAPSDPTKVYAVACNLNSTFEGFYVSTDKGQSWRKSASRTNILSDSPTGTYGQGIYDLCLMVDPLNANRVIVGGLILWETTNAGASWQMMTDYNDTVHPDQHYLAYNQLNKTYYLCNDGGLYTTKNPIASPGKSGWRFHSAGINVTSFYRLSLSKNGQRILAGAQDNNTFYKNGLGNWQNVFFGDGMESLQIENPDLLYASSQYGSIFFANTQGQLQQVFPPAGNTDSGEWTTPFVQSTPKSIIIGGGNVYKIGIGQNYRSLKQISTFSRASNSTFPAFSSAIAVSASDTNTILVAKRSQPLFGIRSGLYLTNDEGKFWNNLSNPAFYAHYISYVAIHPQIRSRMWLSLSNWADKTKVFTTTDGGLSWQNISNNLPNLPANCVVYQEETAKNAGVLYVAMDAGIYYLVDGQTEWQLLDENLPNVIVSELEINTTTQRIYAATFGRGIWSTDLVQARNNLAVDLHQVDIELYPNPPVDILTIKANFNEVDQFEIINSVGVKIVVGGLQKGELRLGKSLPITNLPSGLYYLRLWNGLVSKSKRFMID